MAKNIQADVENILVPFHAAIGENRYKAVCNNLASWLGRQHITTIDGDWDCSAKMKLTSKDKNEMQLPLNDARSALLRFAMNINKLSKAGEFTVNASLPKVCTTWIEKIEEQKVPSHLVVTHSDGTSTEFIGGVEQPKA